MIVVSAGVVLLFLLLSMWVRNRIRETGILISLGFSKRGIVLQHIIEILLVMAVALVVSGISGNIVSKYVGGHLLQYVRNNQQRENSTEGVIDEQIEEINLNVKTGLEELSYMLVVGIGIIVISVTLADINILKMQPKKILEETN